MDVQHAKYLVPNLEINPDDIKIILISESTPRDPDDYYYAEGKPQYESTTVTAFNQAGVKVTSMQEITEMGVYLTTAVKCAKTGYGVKAHTIKECSQILEEELAIFPNVQAYLLMGDVAIKAINYIALRSGEARPIPAGSTYKIRAGEYTFKGVRAFPSYLQAGPSFGIEISKQRMIAEDIASALNLVD